ncbi:hypothetical protein [Oryza sativa Japonica Group]|uniref:Uncharacterized protein n=1 Tax=Oryza sativa subsp. japonica TaxID=39947 RepID=Q8H3N3_ORYSJ|nr:hypothetical protein [Oryza sativa Japonica Group]
MACRGGNFPVGVRDGRGRILTHVSNALPPPLPSLPSLLPFLFSSPLLPPPPLYSVFHQPAGGRRRQRVGRRAVGVGRRAARPRAWRRAAARGEAGGGVARPRVGRRPTCASGGRGRAPAHFF